MDYRNSLLPVLWDISDIIICELVLSTLEFPKSVCSECVSKLEDILSFIENSRNNNASPKEHSELKIESAITVESETSDGRLSTKEAMKKSIAETQFNESLCLICSSQSYLIPVEDKEDLMQLFRNISNIEVKADTCFANGICRICTDKLKDISLFIDMILCNERYLEYAFGRDYHVNYDNYSNQIDTDSSTCESLELKEVSDDSRVVDENFSKKSMPVNEIKIKQEIIDMNTFGTDLKALKEDTLDLTNTNNFQCGKSITGKQKLNLLHSKEKSFKCLGCEKSFSQKRDIQRHMLTHTGEKPFKCEHCSQRFSRKDNLQKHSLQKHMGNRTEEKPFKCDCCNKSYRLKGCLTMHLRVHTGEKPFKCDICGKSFSRKGHLRNHFPIHTGEKPFKCDYCDKSFSRRDGLRIHVRIHTGERPFKCDSCGRSFITSRELLVHSRSHTGEKPFVCHICGKSFSRNNLRSHFVTHREIPFEGN